MNPRSPAIAYAPFALSQHMPGVVDGGACDATATLVYQWGCWTVVA